MGKKGEQQSSYPPEIKLEAIRLHFEEGVPHRLIMIKLGLTSDVIRAWIREYSEGRRDFSTNKSKPRLTYTPEIKLEAARLCVEIGLEFIDERRHVPFGKNMRCLMIEFMYNIRGEKRKLVGPILLACLLFLRLPYLIGVSALFPNHPFLIDFVFNNGTFIITALLIWWERKRLSEFHITLGVLRVIIWAPLVSLIVGLIMMPMSLVRVPLLLPQILISFWLLWNLKKGNFNNLSRNHQWLRWIIIAVIVGLCLAISLSYFTGMQDIGKDTPLIVKDGPNKGRSDCKSI